MVPRAVQDAGYTAVGLGVLALQQLQTRRRELSRALDAGLSGVKAIAAPVGRVVDFGRARLCQALRP